MITVCESLHPPAPISDIALTPRVHSVLAFSPVTISEVAGGEPKRILLLKDVVPHLNCTSYAEMGRSLLGVVQVTLKAVVPVCSILIWVSKTLLTLEGAATLREVDVYE